MNKLQRFRITGGMVVRMAADALMVNFALVAALWGRWQFGVVAHGHGTQDADADLMSYISVFSHNAWLLTSVCLVTFAFCGFYSYGRSYQGRYKALIIVQAVTQSYLIVGFVTYFLWDRIQLVEIPRSALVIAWAVNLGLTLASRMWTFLWEKVVRPEREVRIQMNGTHPKNILVTGGAGYIGSALLPKLLNNGYHVRVLDLFMYGVEPLKSVMDHPNLELVEGDLRDVQKVVQATRGMGAVVHLGAIVGDPACNLDADITVDVNLNATRMIAQVAKASDVRRFIFASTCSVYGTGDEVLDERSETRPISLYGRTKLAAESGLQGMADESFSPTLLRFGTIYGLSGRTRFDLVVNLLAAKAKIDGEITVYGGSQWRPFLHVDDAGLAVFKAVQAPLSDVGNQILNVGSVEQNYTIQQIGELVHEHAIGAELIVDNSTTDLRDYRVSFAKIRRILNFEPQWTVEQGIRQVMDAVANGDVVDYREARYSNVRFLTDSISIESIRAEDDWAHTLLGQEPTPQFAT